MASFFFFNRTKFKGKQNYDSLLGLACVLELNAINNERF